ncbi:alpha/beta fold hydrolase [Shewanella sp. WXL01]|uniref:Alpha/beta fold hydrolase n=1 Tax=Shewanella maritima TaxID=2520507 RepID=A0A411PL97_9GAMM|nr:MULTISPECIES: alpha/beta fold hydrolase [Shewanella]NKF52631.1 alpha/beta fold hydrolase [Shewanella sp. WXL01]QBF84323.1 alpha/beta fold hydrolase [Shewanella maritima]
MRAIVIGSTKHILFALCYALIGIIVAGLFGLVWVLNNRADLDLWHKTELTHQYRGQKGIETLDDYLALEDKLFAEVDTKIYQRYSPTVASAINRFETDSLADPRQWQVNWNRTFVSRSESAQFGVLFIHGMSDSPYSMRHLAENFIDRADVVSLRLPGHGTIPSALTDLHWQDMAKAVALVTKDLKQQLNGKPLYVVGFSTGAALALNHELEKIAKGKQGSYERMVFVSPAIGLPTIAAGAYWQARLGELLGLEKLAWNSIKIEYDPFKYLSFAVNAADVVYGVAQRNLELISQFNPEQQQKIAPILTFQSAVDATVSTSAILNNLYRYLPVGEHQIVMFDVNRNLVNRNLMTNEPLAELATLGLDINKNFDVTLVENISVNSAQVQARTVSHELKGDQFKTLNYIWPQDVFSLSHVALPFPANDPLYGVDVADDYPFIRIGQAIYSGERGLFSVPPSDMLRQKWNPFYPYVVERMQGFIEH